jgi:hypothetical protein
MSTSNKCRFALLVSALVASMAASQASAWNPPDGPPWDPVNSPGNRPDLANQPSPPTTLLKWAHGYITQNGISILYNDGYWFAAQFLRDWQYELLNGVRYADVKDGAQKAVINLCFFWGAKCIPVYEHPWPLAADNHYFNPDTGRGLYGSNLKLAATWADYLTPIATGYLTAGTAYLDIKVEPDLKATYTSALEIFNTEYSNAKNTYNTYMGSPIIGTPGIWERDINGRDRPSRAMFYLGWASHLMQDMTVVHHTYDEGGKHHQEYEDYADGLGAPPIANGQQSGIYQDDLTGVTFADHPNAHYCDVGVPSPRTCFPWFAAAISHDQSILDQAASGDYSNVPYAISFAQRLQAGLYAAFLTDIGLAPVHMSAVMAAL